MIIVLTFGNTIGTLTSACFGLKLEYSNPPGQPSVLREMTTLYKVSFGKPRDAVSRANMCPVSLAVDVFTLFAVIRLRSIFHWGLQALCR